MALLLDTTVSGDGHHDFGVPNFQVSDIIWSVTATPPVVTYVSNSGVREMTRVGWFAFGASDDGSSDLAHAFVGERRYISFEREDWNRVNDSTGAAQYVYWHLLPGYEAELKVFSY